MRITSDAQYMSIEELEQLLENKCTATRLEEEQ